MRKILILYGSYGGGHLSAAKAIYNYIKENYEDVIIEMLDCMEYINKYVNILSTKAYTEMAKKAPWAWGKVYKSAEKGPLSKISNNSNKLMARKLNTYLKEFEPNLIISTHPFSSNMCSYLKRKFGLLSYKIELLPLGVPASFFTEELQPLPQNGLQMIFPAQFRHGKNQDVIIRAFAEHIKRTKDDNSRLVLPGAGDLLNEMKKLVESLGLSDQVEFPGLLSKEDIRQLYFKSNIGIVSSNSETFGQSIVEPFVLGRCVISRPVGIANDIIQNGVNGYIYNHEKELTEIFDNLYAHQELICKVGENNFKERNLFNWERISKKYKNLFCKS